MTHARRLSVGLVASFLLICWGCGGGGSAPPVSSSTQETSVKGTVTINGAPAKGGEITFDPTNINRRDVAVHTLPIDEDGTYSGTTLVGENSVTVSGPQITDELSMNRQIVNLEAGENTVDIAIP